MSLRVRLLIAAGAVALVALTAADFATYHALRRFMFGRVDQTLEGAHVGIERAIEGPRRFGGFADGQAPFDLRRPGFRGESDLFSAALGTFVEVRDSDDAIVGTPISARLQDGREWQPKLPTRISGLTPGPLGGDLRTYFTADAVEANGPSFRVRASNLPAGGQLILAIPLLDTLATLHQLLLIELAVTAAALIAAVGVGWYLVRAGLRPLAAVEQTAVDIAAGHLERRVPGDGGRTEVGRVALALNTMLERIQKAFSERDETEADLRASEETLRRFVADASHELRTPLAAVSAYAELFERGASEHPEDLARVMTGIRTETGRMGRLVQDLLLLARLDDGRPIERKPVELVGLASEAIETARTVGRQWPVQLLAGRPVDISGDRNGLRQVLDNLLANVRTHTPAGTNTRVNISSDSSFATVEVADDGPGLGPEQSERVFERFYRADPSRSRRQGGAGLGLGIVAAIVEAHGGEVQVLNTPGGGATFTVRLPVNGDATGEVSGDSQASLLRPKDPGGSVIATSDNQGEMR